MLALNCIVACELGKQPMPSNDECGVCAENEICTSDKCVCEPTCGAGRAGLPDGCGAICPCPSDFVQNAKGQCVPKEQCTDNCAVAGFTCGVLCGERCGSCAEGSCQLGQCKAPVCDSTRCDNGCACADGKACSASGECAEACTDTCASAHASCGTICGETCGTGTCDGASSCIAGACAPAVSCPECSLKLSLIDKTVQQGRVIAAVLALDYAPAEGEPRPRIADLRFSVPDHAKLTSVELGPGLRDAGKMLFTDSRTQEPYRRRADGTYQLMVYDTGTTETLLPGRLLTLTFAHSADEPLTLSLMRRGQIFAPLNADGALQTTAYDAPVLVTP